MAKLIWNLIFPLPSLYQKTCKKSLNDSNNYWTIALSKIFSKVLEYIIIDKIYKLIYVDDSQFGYKNNLSTNLCTFMTIQTVEYYKNNNSNTFILDLDASKAFDLVKYDKLFLLFKRTKYNHENVNNNVWI